MKLVLAEKPSVAQSIAKVLGAAKREDGYLEGNGYVVSWCVGHLVELAQPEVYDAKYSKWAYADLPIFPMDWQYEVSAGTKKQFGILKKLMFKIGFSQKGWTFSPRVVPDFFQARLFLFWINSDVGGFADDRNTSTLTQ